MTADIVTQLPVPARLGMLRFERINEPSWSLLFLDPACEQRIGLPAADLCGLIESPYASLMQPQARYRLHEDIQQQLQTHASYLISYRVHTPLGERQVVESGEAFRQHQRDLLRGYLLVLNEPLSSADDGEYSDLATENSQLRESLQHYQRSQEEHLQHLVRSRAQQDLIISLTRHRYRSSDLLGEAAQLITQAACQAFEVTRSSLWRLQEHRLVPVAQYQSELDSHELPEPIDPMHYPHYFEALRSGRAIAAIDIRQDPRTLELAHGVLRDTQVVSLLDAGVHLEGELVGVLSLEHSGAPRTWQADEVAFAGELADQFAQVISNQQRQTATHALHLFQRAVEQSANAFLLLDREGRVEYVNPSFTAITQYSAAEVQGHLLSELPALESLADLLFDANSSLSRSNSWQGELRSKRKNQESYWGHLSLSRVHASNGELSHYVGIYEDITENKLAQQRIERLAFSDALTGLGNRPHFIRTLEERFEHEGAALGLLLVDIDNFKRINDSLGHHTGDKLLVSLARRLRNSLPPSSTLARFASNEFAVLLEEITPAQGFQMAEELMRMLEKPLFVDNQLINVTGSVGLACAPDHGRDPETLMKHAGLALHKAKANGRDQLQVFTAEMNAEADYKLFVENNLRRALAQDELEVFYQPKLDLRRGKLVGMEALLRWNHPDKGMIRPDRFISVAEETGLIIPIGKWLVRQACQASLELERLGLGALKIAINLSPKQFSDPDLVGSIAGILAEERLPAERLELELTEGLLLEATESTREQLNQLKALGLTLAMDDFGTGYSSLSYLKKFPIDVLKIDRSFIKDIPSSQDDMEITSAVIAMAHNLRLTVVAEGIETAEQLSFLRRQRCDIGQGYLFDRPIPGNDLAQSLLRYPVRD